MDVNIISSLNNREQRGGAYLRFKTIEQIYKWLNMDSHVIYQDEITKRNSCLADLKSLYYGKNSKTMFQKARLNLSPKKYLHFESLRYFGWDIPGKQQSKVIYNAHNLEFESLFLREDQKSRERFLRYEVELMKKSHTILVCSDREKKILADYCPELKERIIVLPNLVDVDDYYASYDQRTISFIGTLDYYPNQQAIDYLCNEFMPNIPIEIKNKYRFVIAGRSPVEGQAELCEKAGFEFRTDLTDQEVRELHSQTFVSLVPLQHGSGTRLKIIEALCSGAQVLSTKLGTEGIEDPMIVESEIKDFAAKFIELVSNNRPSFGRERLYQYDLRSWYTKNKDLLINKLEL